MRSLLFSIVTSLFTIVCGNTQQLGTHDDSLAYSAGIIVGKNLKMQGLEGLDREVFFRALHAVLTNDKLDMSPREADAFIRAYQKNKTEVMAEANRIEGEQFLAKNAKRPEVKTTASGLQYEVVEMGDGPKPKATDKVYVHYHGTLIDGTVFDSSVERGEPIEFPLNRVISGWTEVLQLMPVGSKFIAYIPYDLAYGTQGAGAAIGPYSTLTFEIELLEIR